MANHSLPVLTSTYANYTAEIKGRIDDALLMLDPATSSPTNVPTNAIRFNSASAKWQKWNSTAWVDLVVSYAINITGNASTASSVAWSGVASKPNTRDGYGITDVPKVNGTGASGTWGISINGNAATATNATTATTATNATTAGACSGNAATATKLATARTINGVSFDGSANIVVAPTIERMDSANTTGYLAFVDSSVASVQPLKIDNGLTYNPSTGVIGASISGNAATATKLANDTGSAPSYSCRAWVVFNGVGTINIHGSGNVSSITDNGVGNYTINFSTALPDGNFAVGTSTDGSVFMRVPDQNASFVRVLTTAANSGGNIGTVPEDVTRLAVTIHR